MDNNEDVVECPLCMEPLEVDDLNFFPCTCGYQICRFCWHRIRTDENKLCPACRKEYTENPADFTPLTQEQILAFKSQKKQRDQKRKQKVRVTENRKHLSNVRVVQRNLVFVVGLPPRLADAEVLKKHEYFGKYGKIHKVVINPSTAYAGVQGPSASAYVTYVNNHDALRAIQSVNTRNIIIDGRLIKTSLGTTKYCSHFMKNQVCPKGDCMYLHELGDPEASFTKEEMHQGKHQEYEKRLHDALAVSSNSSGASGSSDANQANGSSGVPVWGSNGGENNHGTANNKSNKSNSSSQSQATTSSAGASPSLACGSSGSSVETAADPGLILSVSPVNKDMVGTSSSEAKHKKERGRHEKVKNDKNTKSKNKNSVNDVCKSYVGNTQMECSSNLGDIKDGAETPANGMASEFASPVQDRDITSNSSGTSIAKGKINKPKASKKCVDESDNKKFDADEKNIGETEIEKSIISMNNANASAELFESAEVSLKELTDCKESENSKVEELAMDRLYEESKLKNDEIDVPDTNSCLAQLNLFDNKVTPMFSPATSVHNPMRPENKVDDLSSQLNNVKISPLPDLLKGIEEQQFQQVHPHQQKELARLLELHKQNSLFGNMNLSQPNVPPSGLQTQFGSLTDMGQSPLTTLEHASELLLSQNLYGINMSKFFDFHKNQQLQLQQHCATNEQPIGNGSNAILENNSNPYQFMQHSGLSSLQQQQQHQQQQQQKQRNLVQLDSMLALQQHHSTIQTQQHPLLQNQHSRIQNEFSANTFVDDDLGFDPFTETQKGLAELMENEVVKPPHHSKSNLRAAAESNMMHQHQLSMDNMQRARMPPPGFNHMNTFGLNAPREHSASKMMPFSNMTGNRAHSNDIQYLSALNSWDAHLQSPRNQIPNFNDMQPHQMNQNNRNVGNLANDWTAMDPAILSFRQFPSCPQPSQMLHHHQPKDLFPPHLTQQQNSFSNQSHGGANMHLSNNQMSSQSAAQAQVNANVQGMLEYLKNRQFF
ncbi:general negative regulator of transcription subunit 4 [Rhagoletis pomonella]|uniref:general negative regulator of transcription subunit 4 n=1 Tax=Rhagoletis pomonella TaxID=28610 RepID=UPI0017823FAE|nr:general negative regulator of transcription subunit 4 [Rhagoletis pomonella]XP_036325510.1 general negative regulator of transcription subunit 4 [Rhagoletis pomonella]XP_036325511.1 general negative regulator of transcription subunit 4 [Rhagoletis pomonella]XP_036325512.1 general negative regulator of transcription subunit 4 [Rhagoletis pomonella]XP_036325513.1 general negative regulator of transcription subunit 4 [Rhagoletis pomonella]XP_036325514.1 general negative regulator of transcript